MLAAKRLPEVLRTALNDGVEGCCLMTCEGSLLCAVFTPDSAISETSLAAISSSMWNNFLQGMPDTSFYLLQMEEGCLGITTASVQKGYVLSAFGHNVSPGLLRGRLEALSSYFNRVFEQLK